MRTIRSHRVPGFVVIGSGIRHDIDSQTLFQDMVAFNRFAKSQQDVLLIPLTADKVAADEIVVPAHRWWPLRLVWRLVVRWLNVGRGKALAAEMRREAEFYSPAAIEARARARML